jgi:hypothetical protein
MAYFHEKLQEEIIQQDTAAHQQEIAEQLHPSPQRGFGEHHELGKAEAYWKADAKSHDEGGYIRTDRNKGQMYQLLMKYKVITDKKQQDVCAGSEASAAQIPESALRYPP